MINPENLVGYSPGKHKWTTTTLDLITIKNSGSTNWCTINATGKVGVANLTFTGKTKEWNNLVEETIEFNIIQGN